MLGMPRIGLVGLFCIGVVVYFLTRKSTGKVEVTVGQVEFAGGSPPYLSDVA